MFAISLLVGVSPFLFVRLALVNNRHQIGISFYARDRTINANLEYMTKNTDPTKEQADAQSEGTGIGVGLVEQQLYAIYGRVGEGCSGAVAGLAGSWPSGIQDCRRCSGR